MTTAKQIDAKDTRKKKSFSAVIDGVELKAETVKTCVGTHKDGPAKCKKCKGNVKAVCLALTPVAKPASKPGNTTGKSKKIVKDGTTGKNNKTSVPGICPTVYRDNKNGEKKEFFGIQSGTSMYEFLMYLLINGPSSMGQVKKDIRRSHYQTVKQFPGLFIQLSNKKWTLAI